MKKQPKASPMHLNQMQRENFGEVACKILEEFANDKTLSARKRKQIFNKANQLANAINANMLAQKEKSLQNMSRNFYALMD